MMDSEVHNRRLYRVQSGDLECQISFEKMPKNHLPSGKLMKALPGLGQLQSRTHRRRSVTLNTSIDEDEGLTM
jgi:hypothetical protein